MLTRLYKRLTLLMLAALAVAFSTIAASKADTASQKQQPTGKAAPMPPQKPPVAKKAPNALTDQEAIQQLFLAIENNESLNKLLHKTSYKPHINSKNIANDTLLHHAIEHRRPKEIQLLVKQGADITRQNAFDENPLQLCIAQKNIACLKELLKHKSIHTILNKKDKQGDTPLLSAIRTKNATIVNLLVKKDVNITLENKHDQHALAYCVANEYLACLQELLKHKSIHTILNKKNKQGDTPMSMSIQKDNKGIVELLYEKKASLNNLNNKGQNILQLAIAKKAEKTLSFIEKLPQKTLNQVLEATDIDGKTALDSYIQSGQSLLFKNQFTKLYAKNLTKAFPRSIQDNNSTVFDILLQSRRGQDLSAQNYTVQGIQKQTAMDIAVKYKRYAMLQKLIDKKAPPLRKQRNQTITTILHTIIKSNDNQALAILTKNIKSKQHLHYLINQTDQHKKTPLDVAIDTQFIQAIDSLIALGANTLGQTIAGNSLHILVQRKDDKNLSKVLQAIKGSKDLKKLLTQTDLQGKTIFDIAIETDQHQVLKTLLQTFVSVKNIHKKLNLPILHTAIQSKKKQAFELIIVAIKDNKKLQVALLQSKDKRLNHPIHIALEQRDAHAFETLRTIVQNHKPKLNALLNQRNKSHKTPLDITIDKQDKKSFQQLIQANAHRISNSENDNSLHKIIQWGDQDVLTSLLKKNQDKSFQPILFQANQDGKTPFDLALEQQPYTMLQALLAHPFDLTKKAQPLTLLHTALTKKDKKAFDIIMRSIQTYEGLIPLLAEIDSNKQNPLHIAIAQDDQAALSRPLQLLKNKPKLKASLFSQLDMQGNNPLDLAIQQEKTPMIKALMTHGAPLIYVDPTTQKITRTALHTAVFFSKRKALAALINTPQGKQILNTPDAFGNTILHTVATQNDPTMTEAILAHNPDTTRLNDQEKTALDIAKTYGIETSAYQKIKAYHISQHATKPQQKHTKDYTALHQLVGSGDVDELKKKITKHSVNSKKLTDAPTIHYHIQSHQPELVQRCLDKKADIAATNILNGKNALHIAIESLTEDSSKKQKSQQCFDKILNHLTPNPKRTSSKTSKDKKKNKQTTTHPPIINTPDNYGYTPLLTAVDKGQAHILQSLRQAGASIYPLTRNRSNALHIAIEKNHQACFEKIIEIDNKPNKKLNQPNSIVHENSLHLIIPTKNLNMAQDIDGNTPFHLSIKYQRFTMMETLYNKAKQHHRLKELLCTQNQEGDTGLHLAIKHAPENRVLQIIGYALDDSIIDNLLLLPNKQGHLPLHLAVQHQKPKIVETLLHGENCKKNCSQSLMTYNNLGRTPLHIALDIAKKAAPNHKEPIDIINQLMQKAKALHITDSLLQLQRQETTAYSMELDDLGPLKVGQKSPSTQPKSPTITTHSSDLNYLKELYPSYLPSLNNSPPHSPTSSNHV